MKKIYFLFIPLLILSVVRGNTMNLGANRNLSFKENKGQIRDQNDLSRPDVLFSGSSGDLSFYLRNNGISYQLNRVDSWKKEYVQAYRTEIEVPDNTTIYRVDMNWLNINKSVSVEVGMPSGDFDTYYTTNCSNGAKAFNYNDVYYRNIYANITLHYYNKSGELKYDYIVAPGADYRDIKIEIKGANSLQVNEQGGLTIKTPLGNIEEGAPLVFQKGTKLPSRWKLNGNILSFEIDNYDPTAIMIIDPLTRVWGTYSGGANDDTLLSSIEDGNGDTYFCGRTQSNSNIATIGAFQITLGGSYDACIVKFNSAGTKLWGTYIGDASDEIATSIALHPSGDVIISGNACGTGTSITTAVAHQTVFGGNCDGILMRFSPAGARIWGTYYGGAGTDAGNYCCVDGNGDIYLTGFTTSGGGTVIATAGSHQSSILGTSVGYLVKFNAAGVRQWGTYYGGGNNDRCYQCVTNAQNDVYICGITVTSSSTIISTPGAYMTSFGGGTDDAFLAKFNSSGVRQWGTYFGGAGSDQGYSCKQDATGNIYLAGATTSTANISTSGAHQITFGGGANDGFIVKFDATGSTVQWGTYYGGSGSDLAYCNLDAQGYPYLSGWTNSPNAISTAQSYQPLFGGNIDIYISKFTPTGSRLWATYFGGSGQEFNGTILTLGAAGKIYLCGTTSTPSSTIIASSPAFQTTYGGNFDGLIEKFYDCTPFDPTNQTTSTVVCANSSASISALSGTATISWYSSPTATAVIGTGSALATSTLSAGNYTFYAEASLATCSLTSQRTPVVFQVASNPTVSAASSASSICSGQTVTLTANGANTYTWNPGGSGSTISVAPSSTQVYTVVGTATNNCTNSITFTQTVDQSPTITAVSSETNILCIGQSATLTANGASSYTWNPGGSGVSITVSPTVTTTYSIVGTGSNGCTSMSSIMQSVSACTGIDQFSDPTVSSTKLYPNPSSMGYVTIQTVEGSQMRIYSALGQLVMDKHLSESKNNIDISALSKGVYMISITVLDRKEIYRQKLVIQ